MGKYQQYDIPVPAPVKTKDEADNKNWQPSVQ
jgi:hypothetical protein